MISFKVYNPGLKKNSYVEGGIEENGRRQDDKTEFYFIMEKSG